MSNNVYKVLCIKSTFNSNIVDNLHYGVNESLKNSELEITQLEPLHVPGAFELPYMAKKVLDSEEYKDLDCIITLGCVIKGETAHFEYISNACANALATLNINSKIPILFGVITAFNKEQAIARSEINFNNPDNRNIGFNVANAAKTLMYEIH
tara:strand:+ start:511 stop:969 length:459 start_codon:yes stop_codon:yes gene_type:complete